MNYKSMIKKFIQAIFVTVVITSCVKENQGDCGTYIHFVYDYNIQEVDGFQKEADEVSVYVFDSNDNLVTSLISRVTEDDFSLLLQDIPEGKYKLVAWAKADLDAARTVDYKISVPSKGGKSNELEAFVETEEGTFSKRLNDTFYGQLEAEITGRGQNLTVRMKKANNDLRVILLPIRSSQTLDMENYDVSVAANNVRLSYDGSKVVDDMTLFKPYFIQETSSDQSTKSDEVVTKAIVSDISLSRLFDSDDSRLRIFSKITGRNILDIRLEWLLTLQAINEHKSEWSDQEYLDRQDEYSITFFIDDSTWMENRIIINGWVLSLDDTILK